MAHDPQTAPELALRPACATWGATGPGLPTQRRLPQRPQRTQV